MLISRWFARRGEIDDRALAWLLGGEALLEIRVLARRARLQPDTCPPGEALEQINELADFSRDMLNLSQRRRHRPSRGHRSRREQAMRERPMAYRWAVTGPERRAWVLQRLERYGLRWTPPPPLPTPRKGLPTPTWRQRLGVVAGWPVRTPHGRPRLPRQGRRLKALTTEALTALHGTGGGDIGRLRDEVDPDATHYIFPDPGSPFWPARAAERDRWHCTVLVRMVDGEQVRTGLDLPPATFTALPSTVPRLRQLVLARRILLVERDLGLWRSGRSTEPIPFLQ